MSNLPEPPKKEHPSTYFVQDRENQEEITRLTIQDQMLTDSMGGPLPEQADPSRFRRVLDIACGTGGWVITAAQQYPEMSLVGIDISQRMITYAREQAAAAQVSDRVEFHVMDALRMLEFPNAYFHLVNMRFGASFMRTWDWPKLLQEMVRITYPGGVIRLTEPEIFPLSTSPALTQFFEMFLCAMFQSGHLFQHEAKGIIDHLSLLLLQASVREVQTKDYASHYQAGTSGGEAFIKDAAHGPRTLRPFIEKWGCINGDYEALYQQLLREIHQEDFHATWNLRSAWGRKPL